MDAYTRHLHWIRSADEIAEAAIEMTCGGVNPTIQEYPGHIDPAKVATELPAFVKTMQKHGLRVKQIRGGNQTDAKAPHVEAIVGTMGQLGVTHYWMGTDNYDLSKPILPQLDAIKLKVEPFVKLNQKHGTTLMYHTRAGANAVGSVVWDLLYVMKDFDPKHVGFHWDTGHMSHHGSNMWELLMRTAGPYVVAMGWKDRSWQQNLGFLGEGGPYPGPQALLRLRPTAADVVAAEAAGAAVRRRVDLRAVQARLAGLLLQAAVSAAALREAGGFEEGGGGRGGRGGGAGRAFPLPLAGQTFARGGGWTSPYVPMGTGLVDIFRYAGGAARHQLRRADGARGGISERRLGERRRQDHVAARAGHRQSEARHADDPRRVSAVQCRIDDLMAVSGEGQVVNRESGVSPNSRFTT